ncbi:hypothetical protein D068_cds43420 [Bacillus atrophaeus UCMB-5137]|nr:hypothetical protein D068_cds43420 [Bacillus atrophaeus UCMB-5137]
MSDTGRSRFVLKTIYTPPICLLCNFFFLNHQNPFFRSKKHRNERMYKREHSFYNEISEYILSEETKK